MLWGRGIGAQTRTSLDLPLQVTLEFVAAAECHRVRKGRGLMWGQFAASEKGGGVVCQDQFSVLFFLFLPGDKSIFVLLEATLK